MPWIKLTHYSSGHPFTSSRTKEHGVFLPWKAVSLLLLLGLLIGTMVAGYLYSRYQGKTQEIFNLNRMLKKQTRIIEQLLADKSRLSKSLDIDFKKSHRELLLKIHGRAGKLFIQAEEQFRNREWELCIASCRAIRSTKNPASFLIHESFYKESSCEMKLKRPDRALAVVNSGLRLFSENYLLLQRQADILLMMEKWEKASTSVTTLVRKYPVPLSIFTRANYHYGKERYPEAARDFLAVLARGTPDLERAAANNLSLLYAERLGDFRRAEFFLNVLIALSPGSFRADATTGRVALLAGNLERAKRFLESAYRKRPKDPLNLINLCFYYEQVGNEQKLKDFRVLAAESTPGWKTLENSLRQRTFRSKPAPSSESPP